MDMTEDEVLDKNIKKEIKDTRKKINIKEINS